MKIILGSKSPRRVELLSKMGFDFKQVQIECDETFNGIEAEMVAEYLAVKKANEFTDIKTGQLLITADTTVILGAEVLNKPETRNDAVEMLRKLSDRSHFVITGVCIKSNSKMISFNERTAVFFDELSESEINYYFDNYRPYDKAGSYGIQEWIGLNKINRIEGCYFNVVGLPCNTLYNALHSEFGL